MGMLYEAMRCDVMWWLWRNEEKSHYYGMRLISLQKLTHTERERQTVRQSQRLTWLFCVDCVQVLPVSLPAFSSFCGPWSMWVPPTRGCWIFACFIMLHMPSNSPSLSTSGALLAAPAALGFYDLLWHSFIYLFSSSFFAFLNVFCI